MSVIISMTTIPSRLPHIEPCVRSLKAQGLPIYVWLPREVERTGDKFDGVVPEFFNNCRVEVVEDRGSITKLLPALDVANIVITADDDVVYGANWAAGLLEWHGRIPNAALGYRGRQLQGRFYNNSLLIVSMGQSPIPVDILTGTWGALYEAHWFDDTLEAESETCWWADDLVINKHLRDRNIRRFVIPKRCSITPLDGVHQIDALWTVNERGGNDAGLEAVGWWDG